MSDKATSIFLSAVGEIPRLNSQLLDQAERQAARIGELNATIAELRALTAELRAALEEARRNLAPWGPVTTLANRIDALLERTKPQ